MGDQPIPKVMGHFVAKVSDQSPIGFMQTDAAALTLVVVRLGAVNDNQPIEMSRQRIEAAVPIAYKIESERRTILFGRSFRGKTQPDDRVNQATFGQFKLMPAVQ